MSTIIVHILRGLSGSGKSTWARHLNAEVSPIAVCSADHHFTSWETGCYNFNPKELRYAHQKCFDRFRYALRNDDLFRAVVVDNTNTQVWEFAQYVEWALDAGVPAKHIKIHEFNQHLLTDAELAERNIHAVPEQSIRAQRSRWEDATTFACDAGITIISEAPFEPQYETQKIW